MDQSSVKETLQKINEFCGEDPEGFSKPEFNPSKYLVDTLREKASKEALMAKAEELISQENECEQLIQQVSATFSQDLDGLLQLPRAFGEQLQLFRSDITNAKKKVIATKLSLQKNEQNLEKLNFNSMYNKIIYNKLKEVELAINQYHLAVSYMQNRRYLDCSMSLPVLEGKSVLENYLLVKTQKLKQELQQRCSQEAYQFCFLTPRVIFPTQNSMLDRVMKKQKSSSTAEWNLDNSVPDLQPHLALYQKYTTLKNVVLAEYLISLWEWKDFENKVGKLAFIYDVVRSAFNISKSQSLMENLCLNITKAINSLYILLSIFLVHDSETLYKQWSHPRAYKSFFGVSGFTSIKRLSLLRDHVSSSLCLGAILIRKLVIIKKIYNEFNIVIKDQIDINLKHSLMLILSELKNALHDLFFRMLNPRKKVPSEEVNNPLRSFLLKQIASKLQPSILQYPLLSDSLKNGLDTICKKITLIQQIEFKSPAAKITEAREFQSQIPMILLSDYEKEFHAEVGRKWITCIYNILNSETNRLFSTCNYHEHEQVIDTLDTHKHMGIGTSLAKVKKYVSEEKGEFVKEFAIVGFILQEMHVYSAATGLGLEGSRLKLLLLIMLHVKLYTHCKKDYVSQQEIIQIENKRTSNAKNKEAQEKIRSKYKNIIPANLNKQKTGGQDQQGGQAKSMVRQRRGKHLVELMGNHGGVATHIRVIENLKVLLKSWELLLDICDEQFKDLNKNSESEDQSVEEYHLQGWERMSYDENMLEKMRSLLGDMPKEAAGLNRMLRTVFRRMVNLYLILRVKAQS